MAARPETVSFDDIIQAGKSSDHITALMLKAEDRQRRKNEALAQQIFGKNRRASTPSDGVRKAGTGPSLASRVGIVKVRQVSCRFLRKIRLMVIAVRVIYTKA